MPDESHEPDPLELQIIGTMGRLQRLVEEGGLSLEAAIAKLDQPETAEGYLERNAKAIREAGDYLVSPEYLAKVSAALNEPDPNKRARLQANLKRESFARLDLQAVHRQIGARIRQMEAEGVIPPAPKRRTDQS